MLTETRIKLTPTVLDRLRDLYEMEGHTSPFERNAKWLASHIVEDYKVSYDNAYDAATSALTMAEQERRALASKKPLDVSAIDLPALRQEFEERRRSGSTLALDFTEFATDRLSDALTITDEAAQDAVKTALIAEEESKAVSVPEATDADDKSGKKTPISHRSENLIEALSDVMLAREVGAHLLDKARYVQEWLKWNVYVNDFTVKDEKGKVKEVIPMGVWMDTDESAVLSLVSSFLEARYDELKKKGEKPSQIAVLLSKRKARAVLDLSKGALVVSSSIFDKNRDVILTAGRVVVDLRTGKTREVSPFDFFTKRTPITYNPKADDTDLKRLMKALPSDKAEFLLNVAGQSITGHQPSRGFVLFLNGGGSNGKSAVIAALSRVFGGYGGRPSQAVLLKSASGSNAEHHLTAYRGLRGAFFDELPDRRHLDATVVKRIVATPDLTAAGKFEHAQTFPVIASNFVSTNYLPQVSETDEGTWSRLITMTFPFHYTATPKQEGDLHADPRFAATAIRSESMTPDSAPLFEALLARLIQGAMEWYKRRELAMTQNVPEFDIPESVKKETTEWRGITDKFLLWGQECLELDEDEDAKSRFTLTDDLYTSFKQYCDSNGVSWVKKSDFKTTINAHWWFKAHGLTFEDRVRTSQMKQHYWQNPRESWRDSYHPAEAASRANLMRGVKIAQ